MAQITSGIRSILSHPLIYNRMQNIVGAKKTRRLFVRDHVRPFENAKILDIGCGTADILHFLPLSIDYFGFDLNQNYIRHAKEKYAHRGNFICNDINNEMINLPKFDIILATGLLHHLDDLEVKKLFAIAASGLKKEGRLLTFDCCYTNDQSPIARFIISKDRGQNIRTPKGYQKFADDVFQNVKGIVRQDLLWIPYTHFVMECSIPR